MDKKLGLKKELKKWEALNRIAKSTDYIEYLKPILEAAHQNLWIDPDQLDATGKPIFPTYESFHKAYADSRGKAMAFKEIYNMLAMAEKMINTLTEQIKGPEKKYEL